MLVLATVCRDSLVEPETALASEPMSTLQPVDGVPVRVRRRWAGATARGTGRRYASPGR
jgi:hypothetical protein